MLTNQLRKSQRFKEDEQRYSSDEKENEDDYLSLDTSTSISTRTIFKNSTEVLIGIQQKPPRLIDWLPILSIILAAIICLIAFMVSCKQQLDHRRYLYSRIQPRRENRNKNNNHISSMTLDVAECIDGEMKFTAGLNILLAKGNLMLNDRDAQMLNSMNPCDRLQYFQKLANDIP